MIIDMTVDILNALDQCHPLVDWVAKVEGYPQIYANRTPAGVFPSCVIYERFNRDGMFSDDEVRTGRVSYQVSLFSENGTHALVQNDVDKVMRSFGFTLANAFTNEDKNTRIFQRDLIYEGEFKHE